MAVTGEGENGRTAGLPRAVAQVLDADGGVAGAGFLVGEGVLVTCAHVVRAAGGGPGARVRVVFPHAAGARPAEGLVLEDHWRAPEDEDVALVRLGGPPVGAAVLPLGSAAGCQGHPVRSYGFPAQAPVGGHFGFGVAGDLLPAVAGRGVHLQLTAANDLTAGFSGGPVLDEVTGLVVGMLTEITAPDELDRGQGIAYVTPTQVLRTVWPELAEQDVEPYRGLEPFTEEEARWFEGRGDAVRQVLANLAEQRVTLLLGPSGSGKSSLVRAGVLPALADGAIPGSDTWLPLIVRPRQDLLVELERAGLPGAVGDGIAAAVTRLLEARPARRRIVVIIDQFEELFTEPFTGREQERRLAATHQITAAIRSQARLSVVLVMRDDFYPQQAALAPKLLEAAMPGLLNVPATLSREALHDIITLPALKAGAHLEPGLAERITGDVLATTPDGPTTGLAPVTVLPLLELTLSQLWQRRHDGHLSHDAYRRIGGVTGSLTTWCDTALDQLPAEHKPVAQRILTSLVRSADPRHNIPAIREQVPLAELRELAAGPGADAVGGEDVDDVLAALTRHRIITTHTPSISLVHDSPPAQPVAELIHDALIRDWPTLRDWVGQDHRFKQWLDQARARHARWADRKDPGDLLAGTALAEGLEWSQQRRLPHDIAAFLAASRERQRAVIRRSRRLNAVLAGLLALALLAAGGVLWQSQEVRSERQAALSRQLAARSGTLLDANPDLASLLAIRAYRTAPTSEAAESLANAAGLPLRARLTGSASAVNRLAFSPDGHTLATGGRDGTVLLWDVVTGKRRMTLEGHRAEVWAVAFSPDGRTLATGSHDRTVRLWDPDTGAVRHVLNDHSDKVWSVAFSPDGKTLATAGSDKTVRLRDPGTGRTRTVLHSEAGVAAVAFSRDSKALASGGADRTVRIWDVDGARLRDVLAGHTDTVYAVAFSPDGKTLATGSQDRTARLWDLATGRSRHLSGSRSHIDAVGAVAFSTDGRTLATGGFDNAVMLWDTATGALAAVLSGHTDAVNALAFSPDGRTLASGSYDTTVRAWDVAANQVRRTLKGHTAPVRSVAFSPDGRTLASGSHDRTVRLWDAVTSAQSPPLKGHTGLVDSVAFSPKGEILASGGEDGTVRLWNLAAGTSRVLRGDGAPVVAVAFSPDGRTLASGGSGTSVQLWDVRTGKPRGTLEGHTDGVLALAFSPDGRTLASGSYDNTARLWDVRKKTGRVLQGHIDFVWSVAFTPDGRTLATAGQDRTVRLWDVGTAANRATLGGHRGSVTSVAFSPDGRTLATTSGDATVRLWDVDRRIARSSIPLPSVGFSVAFSPDGRTLAWGGQDKTLRLLDIVLLPPVEEIDKICHAVNRDLTSQEKKDYLPGQSVGPVCHI
ncbi:trypsin-like peptidase domain-containing protein [Streptomyces sp. NPDC093225]|uniref:nSTAND1 domain-containing NTPase n=1 Tax=Streptomyces sp. NPDC093225 TaxID=3366034 RepID=UPI0038279ED5